MRYTGGTLRPFNRFLQQAIRAAKERQVRYQLPWQPAGGLREIHLSPVDRRVLAPHRPPAWRIDDWPPDVEPDPTQKLMVVSRGLTMGVLEYQRDTRGVRIRLDGEPLDDDIVWWCGRQCTVVREARPPAPSVIEDSTGTRLRLTGPPEAAEDGWVLVVEGWDGRGHLIVDGDHVEPRELPASEGLRRLWDSAEQPVGPAGAGALTGDLLTVDELPAEGPLTGDNGVRFRWQTRRTGRRTGAWVQLLPPETEDTDEFIDPRAAFCGGEIQEVWTQQRHRPETVFKVVKVDAESYQLLLDRLPPRSATSLFLPVDNRNLMLQRRALRQLTEAPLPHHQGLLRLCERTDRVQWPRVDQLWPDQPTMLTDKTRDGTEEQLEFVAMARGSPDLTILEGPPGSGKTTAICELIQQEIRRGKRVLLCSSTHVAVDNVLDRLREAEAPVDPVRIGRVDSVDEKLRSLQIDQRVATLVQTWRSAPHMRHLSETELTEMAERTVVSSANLTCGTTMGIINHPLFRDRDQEARLQDRPITTMPHWDVLIMDEASKTLIQEFLVPALMARRWVVVGDYRQLPPFTDRGAIVANLRSLVDEQGREVFPHTHQRACLIRFRLSHPTLRAADARWLVVELPGVLDRLQNELANQSEVPLSVARVVPRTRSQPGPFHEVSVEQVKAGDPAALALAACDWVLVGDDVLLDVADHLPADLLPHRDLTTREIGVPDSHPLLFRHAWWLARAGRLSQPYRERGDMIATFADAEAYEQRWLAGRDLAGELAWRLTRVHELRHSHGQRERERRVRELTRLQPVAVKISEPIAEIQDIGLPSILEVLQQGIGAERATRASALTEGMPRRQAAAFGSRFVSLSYQHRMHAEISDLPRKLIYGGRSLRDANTIEARDRELNWTFVPFRRRRVWVDVRGRDKNGVNADEVRVMEGIIRSFLAWAEKTGKPCRDSPRTWEVACLSFYVKQERAMSDMLRRVTKIDRRNRFRVGEVELVCATVDRFQGREADLVLLSMRNTGRVGFLDSLNRLNVAITRARQQLVVVGHAGYFERCRVDELEELARESSREEARTWLGGRP
jgi:hypothetical protein